MSFSMKKEKKTKENKKKNTKRVKYSHERNWANRSKTWKHQILSYYLTSTGNIFFLKIKKSGIP